MKRKKSTIEEKLRKERRFKAKRLKKKNYCGDRRSATQSGAGAVLGR
jgi:hypothetical protein